MGIALIVGSGMDFLAPGEEWLEVATPYGQAYISSITMSGTQVILLRRHGPKLNIPPHLVNYRANLQALYEMGVTRIMSTAAVGSLRHDLIPGSLAVLDDFIDFTKRRTGSIFDSPGERVIHVDFSVPYCPAISDAFEEAASHLRIDLANRVTYVCVDGPRYETPAEIRMFAGWGGDVVGMTSVPEVVIAREMGLCYGSLAIVTNYAAGIFDQPVSHQEVLSCVAERRQQVHAIIERVVQTMPDERDCCCRIPV